MSMSSFNKFLRAYENKFTIVKCGLKMETTTLLKLEDTFGFFIELKLKNHRN